MSKKHSHIDPTDNFNDDAINRGLREEVKHQRRGKTSIWLLFGVGILIILLLVWLTIADFWGDTDVAADFIRLL